MNESERSVCRCGEGVCRHLRAKREKYRLTQAKSHQTGEGARTGKRPKRQSNLRGRRKSEKTKVRRSQSVHWEEERNCGVNRAPDLRRTKEA